MLDDAYAVLCDSRIDQQTASQPRRRDSAFLIGTHKPIIDKHVGTNRLVHMIVLVITFNIAELIIGAVVVFQFLSKLLTGKANEQLKTFGAEVGIYLSSIVRFLTFETDDKPFPYSPWAGMQTGSGDKAEPAKPKHPRRRTPAKQVEPLSESVEPTNDPPD